MGTSLEITSDGRVRRSERSRQAIVRAMLELIGQGVLQPTVQQVALRAQVGVRTVFRHFNDMERLFVAINAELREEVGPLFVTTVQSGRFDVRVEGLLARRIEIFDRLGPYLRASAIQRWRSSFLQADHERMIRILRRDLARWLPEVDRGPTELVDALELVLSFEAWDRLRTDQKLGARRASEALKRAVRELAVSLAESGAPCSATREVAHEDR